MSMVAALVAALVTAIVVVLIIGVASSMAVTPGFADCRLHLVLNLVSR
jgi:hypothetical protein